MNEPPFVDGTALARLLTMKEAIDKLDAAFTTPVAETPDRSHLDVGGGDLLVMPAWSGDAMGVKLVTVSPDNAQRGLPLIHGVYVLFDKPSLAPVALFDAAPLTALRTAAVSGVATRHLAREDARNLVLFGAGTQATAHLETMAQVRPIDRVTVVSRTRASAEALAQTARDAGYRAETASAEAVADADVVCTCTTSNSPVFDGSLLQLGTHVNAVGSYKPNARELDDAAVAKAAITIDVDTALRESGDLTIPLGSGAIDASGIRLLTDVIAGAGGRTSPRDITIFKSVGAAFEDLAVAQAAAERL